MVQPDPPAADGTPAEADYATAEFEKPDYAASDPVPAGFLSLGSTPLAEPYPGIEPAVPAGPAPALTETIVESESYTPPYVLPDPHGQLSAVLEETAPSPLVRPRRWSPLTIGLAVAAVLLLAFGATATTLWIHESGRVHDLNDKVNSAQLDYDDLEGKYAQATDDAQTAQSKLAGDESTIQDQKSQIAQLQSQNSDLSGELSDANGKIGQFDACVSAVQYYDATWEDAFHAYGGTTADSTASDAFSDAQSACRDAGTTAFGALRPVG